MTHADVTIVYIPMKFEGICEKKAYRQAYIIKKD